MFRYQQCYGEEKSSQTSVAHHKKVRKETKTPDA